MTFVSMIDLWQLPGLKSLTSSLRAETRHPGSTPKQGAYLCHARREEHVFTASFFFNFFGDLAGNSKSKTSEHLERTLQPPDFYCNSGMEIAQNVLVT